MEQPSQSLPVGQPNSSFLINYNLKAKISIYGEDVYKGVIMIGYVLTKP